MSGLPFELLLALRYLRPKRTFVSVISLISVLAVCVGVAVLIIVISVMSGFDHQIRDEILGFNSHMKVYKNQGSLNNYRQLMTIISSNRNVRTVAPFLQGRVLVETEPQNGQSMEDAPYLRGLDPALETKISVLPQSIIDGNTNLAQALSNRGLLIGSEFASSLRLKVGDHVSIYSPEDLKKLKENHGKKGEQAPLPDDYEVRGIFDVGYDEYDQSTIMTSLEDAQELFMLEDSVRGLVITLQDPCQAPEVAKQLEKALGPDYRVTTWMKENSGILGALLVEKNVMFYLLFCIMIVAALCILSALITFVVQKTREIGMLKALGATDLQVSGLFLSQGGFVGLAGVGAGLGLGLLAVAYRNEFLDFMKALTHSEWFPAQVYGAKLPAVIIPGDIILICGSALVICILGGAIPAWRAGRLKPVDALRYV